jgi:histidine triad (HIT) family protein
MKDFYCDQILSNKLKIDKIFESESILAFYHTNPYFERHAVIIPKDHIDSLTATNGINSELAFEFLNAIKYVASIIEKEFGGCRVSSNIGNYQSTKHLHWYIHAGKRIRNEEGTHILKSKESENITC